MVCDLLYVMNDEWRMMDVIFGMNYAWIVMNYAFCAMDDVECVMSDF